MLSPVATQPLSGMNPRFRVGRKHCLEIIHHNHRFETQDFFDDTRDFQVANPPVEKRGDRDLVRSIEHRRSTVTRLGSLPRQAQAWKTLLVRRLKIQTGDSEQIQRRHP